MMNGKIESFFRSVRGKKVVFCGVGTSNLPLVQLFLEKGAEVTACDRREREQLGKAADDMEQNGAVLKLGARYLDCLLYTSFGYIGERQGNNSIFDFPNQQYVRRIKK